MDSPPASDTPKAKTLVCKKCGIEKTLIQFEQRAHPPGAKNKHCQYKDGVKQPCKLCISMNLKHQPSDAAKRDFRTAMAERIELYQFDALEALHDLAMIKVTKGNKALMQVKFLAANRLAPAGTITDAGASMDRFLQNLNAEYQTLAPRIREVRERITTFVEAPPTESEPLALTGSAQRLED